MKLVNGWYLPDDDTHFESHLGVANSGSEQVEYQAHQKKQAYATCTSFRTALDIGAHVGLWSRGMSVKFKRVISFEPFKGYIPILKKNAPNVEIHNHALGEKRGKVELTVPEGNTGAAYISGDGEIDVIPLDDLGPWSEVDFIKIDCEGYELPVLKGAVKLLQRNNPVIIVEQKPHKHFADKWGQYDAIGYLETLGYQPYARIIDDWILKKP